MIEMYCDHICNIYLLLLYSYHINIGYIFKIIKLTYVFSTIKMPVCKRVHFLTSFNTKNWEINIAKVNKIINFHWKKSARIK